MRAGIPAISGRTGPRWTTRGTGLDAAALVRQCAVSDERQDRAAAGKGSPDRWRPGKTISGNTESPGSMRSSVARSWWLLSMLTSAVLCVGCQSGSSVAHYPDAIDACRLPGPNMRAQLAPGTVEIPADSVKTAE